MKNSKRQMTQEEFKKEVVEPFEKDGTLPPSNEATRALINVYFEKYGGLTNVAALLQQDGIIDRLRSIILLASKDLLSPNLAQRQQAQLGLRREIFAAGASLGDEQDENGLKIATFPQIRQMLKLLLKIPSQLNGRTRLTPNSLGQKAVFRAIDKIYPDNPPKDKDQPQRSYKAQLQRAMQRLPLARKRGMPDGDTLFNSTNQIGMFANWAAKTVTTGQKRIGKYEYDGNKKVDVDNQRNPYYKGLNALGLASWKDNKWQGPGVDKALSSVNSSTNRLEQKIAQSKKILNMSITQDQAAIKVPPIITSIIQSNKQLSRMGFGPIKKDGLPLYAGRWLDPVTGNIRVLPTASKKYLNPISAAQKVAYSQARMLNLWNQILNEYQSTIKWADPQNQKKLQTKIQKQIQNGLNTNYSDTAYNNFINQQIKNFYSNPFSQENPYATLNALSTRNLILNGVNKQLMRSFFMLVPNFPSNTARPQTSAKLDKMLAQWGGKKNTNTLETLQSYIKTNFFKSQGTQLLGDLLTFKLIWWKMAITKAARVLKLRIQQSASSSNNPALLRITASINDATYYLIAFFQKRINSTLQLVNKIQSLPVKPTDMKSILSATKVYDTTQELLNNTSNMILSGDKKAAINSMAQKIRQHMTDSPLTLQTASSTLTQQIGPMFALLKGLQKNQYSDIVTARKSGPQPSQYEERAVYRSGKRIPFNIGKYNEAMPTVSAEDVPVLDLPIAMNNIKDILKLTNSRKSVNKDDDENQEKQVSFVQKLVQV